MGDAVDTRERILAAAYAQITRMGLARLTVEAVVHESGVSRATIYRYFPGGRDQLVSAVVSWEVGEFFEQLAADSADAVDFADWLARRLAAARRRLEEHEVLHHALELEADQILPPLLSVMPIVHSMLRDELAQRLAGEQLGPGVDRGEAADFLARMMLSFIGTPGCWPLDDPAAVDRLVRQHLLAGILPEERRGRQ